MAWLKAFRDDFDRRLEHSSMNGKKRCMTEKRKQKEKQISLLSFFLSKRVLRCSQTRGFSGNKTGFIKEKNYEINKIHTYEELQLLGLSKMLQDEIN